MRITTITRGRSIPAALMLTLLLAGGGPALALDIAFEFEDDGVFPSSEGAAYEGNVLETDAHSVSGGILAVDTLTLGAAAEALYRVDLAFNHAFHATLEWRVQVHETPLVGFMGGPIAIKLAGGGHYYHFAVEEGYVRRFTNCCNGGIGTMDTMTAPRTFRVEIPANSLNYDFYLDDVLFYKGVGDTLPHSENYLFFGDPSPVQGGRADWHFVRLTNLPEPSTLTLVAAGLGLLGALRLRES